MDVTSSPSDLLAAALAERDESSRWDLVMQLHHRETPETYEAARALVASPDPSQRRLGADILAQLGALPWHTTPRRFRLAAVDVLLRALEDETDPEALDAIVVALGHLGDPRAVQPLARLRRHADADIRFAVAWSLGQFPDPAVVDALIELSADVDARVRDWATMGLGQEELLACSQAPRVREALANRLSDDDEDTRFEAAMGLALAGDPRAVDPVLEMMSFPDPTTFVEEAVMLLVAKVGDPRLCRYVEPIFARWTAKHDDWWLRPVFETALRRCRSTSPDQLTAVPSE